MKEMTNDELPYGWTKAPLSDLVDVLDSKRIPLNADEREQRIKGKQPKDLVPYYGATGQVGYIDEALFDEPLILLGEDGVPFFDPLRHKAYRVRGRTWVNNHAHVLRARNNLTDERYIAAFLNSFDYTGYVTGSTRLKLTQGSMNSIPVSLAPLPEQKRIADKLESVLGRVDACRARLDRVPALLKRFRQSVLSAATSRRLTAEWRMTNGVNDEWEDVTLGTLMESKPRNGYSPKSVDFETPTRSLTLTATTSGKFRGEHSKFINEKIPSSSHLWLVPGDILIQRANTLEYVGVSAIFDGPPGKFIYPDLMMKCRANERTTTGFLHILLQSDPVRAYFRENATGTAGNMPKINQGTVIAAPAVLPTLPEQQEIARRVEALFAIADRIEARLATAQKTIDRLTPATLAKAFRGELVHQDPNDEPASALLKRITTKDAHPAKSKTKNRRVAIR